MVSYISIQIRDHTVIRDKSSGPVYPAAIAQDMKLEVKFDTWSTRVSSVSPALYREVVRIFIASAMYSLIITLDDIGLPTLLSGTSRTSARADRKAVWMILDPSISAFVIPVIVSDTEVVSRNESEGTTVGSKLGAAVGDIEGKTEGATVGTGLGSVDGTGVGILVGVTEGA